MKIIISSLAAVLSILSQQSIAHACQNTAGGSGYDCLPGTGYGGLPTGDNYGSVQGSHVIAVIFTDINSFDRDLISSQSRMQAEAQCKGQVSQASFPKFVEDVSSVGHRGVAVTDFICL